MAVVKVLVKAENVISKPVKVAVGRVGLLTKVNTRSQSPFEYSAGI